ncbi:MAG: flagellar biosynthetic protein FliO [Spirochaetia bacterium]
MSLYAQDKTNILDENYAADSDTASANSPASQNIEPVGPTLWDYISMVLGLGVVVIIIVVIFYAIKKGMTKKIVENEMITIMGSKIITGNKVLHLIEVGGSVYLIGSSNESLSLISEISDKETRDNLKLKASQARVNPVKGFGDMITGFLTRRQQKKQVINNSINFMKEQRSRLQKLNK